MTVLDALAAELAVDPDVLRDRLTTAQADSLAVNYLSANPDGTVGAVFSAHVKAAGVDMDAEQTDPTPWWQNVTATRRLAWLRPDGNIAAQITGKDSSAPAGTDQNGVEIQAYGTGSGGGLPSARAAISAIGGRAFTATRVGYVVVDVDAVADTAVIKVGTSRPPAAAKERVLLDTAGASSFLQLVGAAARVNIQVSGAGAGVVSWPGGRNASDQTPVNHGLGVVPKVVLVVQSGGSHYAHFEADDSTWTDTTVLVDAYSLDGIPSAGQTARFRWAAIG